MTNIRYVKQFGVQRSGTNITRAIIENNCKDVRVLANILGEKHKETSVSKIKDWTAPADELEKYGLNEEEYNQILKAAEQFNLSFVLTIKSPLSWLVSLHKYRQQKLKRLNGKDYVLPFDNEFIEKNANIWINLNRQWLQFFSEIKNVPSHVMFYDQYVLQPRRCFSYLQKDLRLELSSNKIDLFQNKEMKRSTDNDREKNIVLEDKNFQISYYQKKEYLKLYDANTKKFAKEFIASRVDCFETLSNFIQE